MSCGYAARCVEGLCLYYIAPGLLRGTLYTLAARLERRHKVETKATSKGQIVIPSSVRRKFGIKEGTHIQIVVDENAREIILKPITREYVHSLRGRFKGKGLLKALMACRKQGREL
jgi:AbrB family looped-hinge helix DNA binding protein